MLTNFRDLGGVIGFDGRKVRMNRLFRSDRLIKATEDDIRMLESIPITMVIDFRTPLEKNAEPDKEVPGAVNVHIPVLDRFTTGITHDKKQLSLDTYEAVVAEMVKDEDFSIKYFIEFYDNLVRDRHAMDLYGEFVRMVYNNARVGASLWHCTQGKDRAGIGTLIILAILGVSEDDIRKDYMLTNSSTNDEIEDAVRYFMTMAPEGVSKKPFYDFVTARDEYLQAFYDAIDDVYGGMDAFLTEGLKLNEKFIIRFREEFLEP